MLQHSTNALETPSGGVESTKSLVLSGICVDGFILSESLYMLGSQGGSDDELSNYFLSNFTESVQVLLCSGARIVTH